MLRRIAIDARPLPLTRGLTDIRTYLAIAAFVVLSVLTPWAFHQYPAAGPTFLPMHLFIFVAALAGGWQTGAIVGLMTPLASFAVSGMPPSRHPPPGGRRGHHLRPHRRAPPPEIQP